MIGGTPISETLIWAYLSNWKDLKRTVCLRMEGQGTATCKGPLQVNMYSTYQNRPRKDRWHLKRLETCWDGGKQACSHSVDQGSYCMYSWTGKMMKDAFWLHLIICGTSALQYLFVACRCIFLPRTWDDFTKVTPDSRKLSATDIPSGQLWVLRSHLCGLRLDSRHCSHHVLGSGWPSKRAAGGQACGTQGDRGEALRARPGVVKTCEKTMAIEIQPWNKTKKGPDNPWIPMITLHVKLYNNEAG